MTSEAELIQDGARRLIASEYDLTFVRNLESDRDESLRRLLTTVKEMGWPSLIIGEDHDGMGLGFTELCGLLYEHGRGALPSLFFSNYVLPALCLNSAPECKRSSELLRDIAAGERVANVVADTTSLQSFANGSAISATAATDGYRLDGKVDFLTNAEYADVFLIPANAGNRCMLFAVNADDKTLDLGSRADRCFGHTNSLAFDGTFVEEDAVILLDVETTLASTFLLASVAKAAELTGGAERALQFAVEHITARTQFGKKLAEFQAVQHQAADAFKAISVAKLFLTAAAEEIDSRQPVPETVHSCKAFANRASFLATKTGHQLMGGTGYMMETDLHLLTLHGLRNMYEFGSEDDHKEQLAQLLQL